MRSKRLQREVDELVAKGWRIESEDRDRVVMVDREFGSFGAHLIIAVFTFWWTMGLGNLAYGAYEYFSNSRRRVLWEDGVGCPNCGAEVAEGASYCPSCGTDVETTETNGVPCPECDAVVREGARYCSACGAKLSETFGSVGSS